jgi:hypothetical protein
MPFKAHCTRRALYSQVLVDKVYYLKQYFMYAIEIIAAIKTLTAKEDRRLRLPIPLLPTVSGLIGIAGHAPKDSRHHGT